MNVSLIGHQSQENQERPLVGAAQTGAPSESVSRSVGPTLCDPRDCSPPDSPVHGDSPGKSTGVGCHFLLQGIVLTQGWNSGLLHCRQSLYCLSHEGSPKVHREVLNPEMTFRHPVCHLPVC